MLVCAITALDCTCISWIAYDILLSQRHLAYSTAASCAFVFSYFSFFVSLFSDPGETRKSWVLAEITEKEYCQAKKVRFDFLLCTNIFHKKELDENANPLEGSVVGGGDCVNKNVAFQV